MNRYAYDSGGRNFMMGGSLATAVRMLMAWNVIVFLLQLLMRGSLEGIFGLVPARVWGEGWIWQIVTYMFLHGGFLHIFFNMLALWMFGSELEFLWGTRRFVQYYFLCGIGGAILTLLTSAHGTPYPTIGASAAVFGILLAYGVTFPNRPILLYFLFPIPAKYFVMIFGLLELYSSLSGARSGVAHWAHVGGLLTGLILLKGIPMLTKSRRRRKQQNFRVLEFHDRERDDDNWR
ncbi:MAG: rhomboid family intramembrane serine protease [Candidatus Eisenbacteria bacterium]